MDNKDGACSHSVQTDREAPEATGRLWPPTWSSPEFPTPPAPDDTSIVRGCAHSAGPELRKDGAKATGKYKYEADIISVERVGRGRDECSAILRSQAQQSSHRSTRQTNMADLAQDSRSELLDGEETINLGLYETGGEEGSSFRLFNVADDQYHRAEVLQRTGAINITCNLEKVVHGAMSEDSDRYATLIVMQWHFQPKGSRRISEATIGLLFEATSDEGLIEVEKVSFPGSYSLMPTSQEETVVKGGEASVGIEQFAALNLTGKWEKTIATTTSDAITLSGGKQVVGAFPPPRVATWTLCENQSQPSGIPTSLKVAVLVSRDSREKFSCRLAFACKTDLKTKAGSFFKKIPKDDPIIFQPDPRQKGTRPNRKVTYGDDELENVDLEDFSDVTFRTVITDGEKTRK